MKIIRRNMPVLIIGGITALLFLIIIAISQKKSSTAPTLTEVEDAKPKTEETPVITFPLKIEEATTTPEPEELPPAPEIKPLDLPVLEITYTLEGGFLPRGPTAFMGQKVRWTNKSNQDITIAQYIHKFPEFEEGLTIKPGESFEFLLTDSKLWTYREKNTGAYGSIFIKTQD